MFWSGDQLLLEQRSESTGNLLPGQGGATVERQPEHCGVTHHLLLHYQVVCLSSVRFLLFILFVIV